MPPAQFIVPGAGYLAMHLIEPNCMAMIAAGIVFYTRIQRGVGVRMGNFAFQIDREIFHAIFRVLREHLAH